MTKDEFAGWLEKYCHWHTELIRPASGNPYIIDGIFMVRVNEEGLCEEFREWWHSEERQAG